MCHVIYLMLPFSRSLTGGGYKEKTHASGTVELSLIGIPRIKGILKSTLASSVPPTAAKWGFRSAGDVSPPPPPHKHGFMRETEM